jgi:hypothetical protein
MSLMAAVTLHTLTMTCALNKAGGDLFFEKKIQSHSPIQHGLPSGPLLCFAMVTKQAIFFQ